MGTFFWVGSISWCVYVSAAFAFWNAVPLEDRQDRPGFVCVLSAAWPVPVLGILLYLFGIGRNQEEE